MKTLVISAAILGLLAAPALAQPPPPPGPHGPWGPQHHEMMRHMMHMMHQRNGDTFRFKKGDATIDIHCSPQQPVQVCVEAATRIMQGITQMSQAHGQSASQTGGGNSSSGGTGTGATSTH